MKRKKIVKNGEKISVYSFFERIGYAKRNSFFPKKRVPMIGFKYPFVPTNFDIHVHNIWKDLHN